MPLLYKTPFNKFFFNIPFVRNISVPNALVLPSSKVYLRGNILNDGFKLSKLKQVNNKYKINKTPISLKFILYEYITNKPILKIQPQYKSKTIQCLLDFICLAGLKAAVARAPSALFHCNTRTT